MEIIRKDRDGKVTKWHAPYGDSLDVRSAREIDVTDKDREIYVVPHDIEHYTLTLKCECPKGTLGIISDMLEIGVTDGIEVRHICRSIDDTASSDENPKAGEDMFLFEENKLVGYEGRPTKSYRRVKDKIITRKLPGFTNGIPDDKSSVLEPSLTSHYESFKQLRPDMSGSLEACLDELKKR